MIEIRKEKELNVSKGAESLLKFLQENKNQDNKYTVSTKKQLAKDYGLSLSTVSKRLKELEDDEVIKTVTKRGANGGIIITFLVEPTESYSEWVEKNETIIESESQYAKNLREKVFPKYIRPLGNGRPRRTKEEMRAYKLAKNEHEKNLVDMNTLKEQNYPSKKIFNMADDPEGYFRAYILTKLYDFLCYKYMATMRNTFSSKDEITFADEQAINYYEKKANDYRYKDSVGDDYFGSRRFNIFYTLQSKFKEWNLEVHDFSYINEVFNNYTRSFEKRRGLSNAFKSPVPYTNYLYSESAISGYEYRIKRAKHNRFLYGFNSPVEHDISTVGSKSILYNALKRLYDLGLNDSGLDLEQLFNDTLTVTDIIKDGKISYDNGDSQLNRNSIVYTYYKDTLSTLSDTGMRDDEYDTMVKYFANLHMFLANPDRLSNLNKTSMFPIEQRTLIDKYSRLLETTKSDDEAEVLYSMMARMGSINNPTLRRDAIVGKEIKESLTNNSWVAILSMYGDYRNITVNANEVNHILNKYDLKDTFLFTQEGLLDYNKIVKWYIEKEQD